MVSLLSIVDFFLIISFLAALRAFRDHRRRGGSPYPPGPRPLPVIGNLLDIPREFSWIAYTELAKKYGDVMSLHVLGRVIIILGSTKATKGLLEKRGHTYSDRPVIPFFDMMEVLWALPFEKYGPHFRLTRKIADRCYRPASLAQYRVMQERKTRLLAKRMFINPQEWAAHIELFQGEQLLSMTYGYDAKGPDDRILDAGKKLSDLTIRASLPGSFLVNELPFLRHIPEWLPWFSYKPIARVGHDLSEVLKNDPMIFVRENMLIGTAQSSMASESLTEAEKLSRPERETYERVIAETLGVMYSAGTDTIVSTMMSFVLAVVLHPDLQRKAQDEIDAVTGRTRFPTFEDRPKLPFVDACCREVLRWRPAAPLHVPHAASEDRVYEGFFIPKGAWVIGNIWAILHDPDVYPEPEVFNPERFLNPDGTLRDDPTLSSVFGFGKRVCPGKHLVDATLFIFAVTVLSVLRIEKGRDSKGGPFGYTYSGDLVSRPNAFPCSITTRDKIAEELIMGADAARV